MLVCLNDFIQNFIISVFSVYFSNHVLFDDVVRPTLIHGTYVFDLALCFDNSILKLIFLIEK